MNYGEITISTFAGETLNGGVRKSSGYDYGVGGEGISIELLLDKADDDSKSMDERLSHEEVFTRLRKLIQ